MTPLVSIVIPVYNGENYLKGAIDCALAQTYNSVEVLVINDGSTDKTEEIVLSYGEKVRYFAKENGGVSSALNMGIANMRGEYFSWLSHDDLYVPEKVEREITAIADDPAAIVYSDYTIIDKDGATIVVMDIAQKFPGADLTLGLYPILRQVLNGCSLLIHKSHFLRIGVFDESLRVTQDYDLWFKMFRGQRLAYVHEPLVLQREHGTQVTHNYARNLAESDKLWVNMLANVTPEECCLLDGSELAFWDRQEDFLYCTHYTKAKKYATMRLKALGGVSFSLSKLFRRAMYNALSGISKLTHALGIQKAIKESKLFGLGYKMWFRVRYR